MEEGGCHTLMNSALDGRRVIGNISRQLWHFSQENRLPENTYDGEEVKQMPQGDGTGPRGQGPKTGRGQGQGAGRGQGRGAGKGQGTGRGQGQGAGKGQGQGAGRGKGSGRGSGQGRGRQS
jgi:hypothetical protein